MSTNIDSRGVKRGDCCMCSCDQYNGGTKRIKCVDCGHPPAKHRNALTGSVAQPASVGSISISRPPTLDSFGDDEDIDLVTDSLCQFPGCRNRTDFDPNTGLQDEFCPDHTDVPPKGINFGNLSLSDSPPTALYLSQLHVGHSPNRHPASAGPRSVTPRPQPSLPLSRRFT